jgi:hypothetical protein
MAEAITDEFGNVDLADARRNRRLNAVVTALSQAPAASISGASGGWNESMAAYRLLSSAKVKPQALLAPHQQAVARRCADHACVIVSQDTTELDFTRMKEMQGLGPLNSLERRGFFMHSLYAATEAGLPLGLWDLQIMVRSDETFHRNLSETRPIEEKESLRWIEGYHKTCELARALPQCEVFSISDREGDIFELYAAWQKAAQSPSQLHHAEWIIRASKDRALVLGEDQETAKLFETLACAPLVGEIEFGMRARQGSKKVKGSTVSHTRSARTVHQEVRVMKVTPRPPKRKGGKLPAVAFWAVLAQEKDPPQGESPISWLLLTSKPTTTLEEARRIVNLYLRRWDIEVFHRVLKTGCKIEGLQLKGAQAVLNALTLYAVIAWRILYLTHLGRQCPDLPCSSVFDEMEWRATCAVVKRPSQLPEPTLSEFIKIVGKLGGHLGRKSDGPPGPKAMWQGMARVRDFACAWQMFHSTAA